MATSDHIGVLVRFPNGKVTSHTIRSLQRAALNASTGIAPSWADPETRPGAERGGDGEVAGAISADLGPVLERPGAPMEIVVVAGFGPYKSNEVRIELRP